MSPLETLDCLVLGSGNGGMYLAWDLARSGRKTAVVERQYIGGSCPNINCLPSKNEIWSARAADLVRHAAHYGVTTGDVTIDMAVVRQRKRDMVEALKEGTLEEYRASGAELIMGNGRFTAPRTVEVQLNQGGTRVLTAGRMFLNLGTHPRLPNIPGLEAARPLTNIEALELGRLPEHLLVLGGGYVGLELAQAFRRFGSRVTIIQNGSLLSGRVDPEVSDEIQRILTDDGIDIITRAEVRRIAGVSGRGVSAVAGTPAGERTIEATDLLVAAGRTPNTAGVGLEIAGVELDGSGYIRVNDRLETTARDIWGMGECCAGNPQFTHASYDDYRIVRDNMAGGSRTRSDRLVPYCMFTDPPLAHVGLTEREAQERGIPVRIARLPVSWVMRTRTTGEMRGFMKALVAADGDRILGFTMIGSDAGEVMAAVQVAMLAGMPYTGLRDAVIAHPTMAEGLGSLFAAVPARAA